MWQGAYVVLAQNQIRSTAQSVTKCAIGQGRVRHGQSRALAALENSLASRGVQQQHGPSQSTSAGKRAEHAERPGDFQIFELVIILRARTTHNVHHFGREHERSNVSVEAEKVLAVPEEVPCDSIQPGLPVGRTTGAARRRGISGWYRNRCAKTCPAWLP